VEVPRCAKIVINRVPGAASMGEGWDNAAMDTPQQNSPRERLRELLAIPDRQRTDEQWDELNDLEIRLASGNREDGPDHSGRRSMPQSGNQPRGGGGGGNPGGGDRGGGDRGGGDRGGGNPQGKRPFKKFHKRPKSNPG
jgi:hypothetical protein